MVQHRYAGAQALGGWLPTPDGLRALGDVLSRASAAAQEYAAPVPSAAREFYPLLVVAGAATAVLVDLLAVGLRRVPLAGLPLLAAYTAPVSILDGGVPWISFAAAALCFLFLMAAVEGGRLARWGQRLTPGQRLFDLGRAPAGSGGVWSSARTIGVTATALALVVPLLLPTFAGTLFDGGSGTGNGSGDAVSISNPMVDLKRDLTRGADVDLVRVSTRDPDPSYLRITVLDSFDGNAWRPADRDIPVEQRAYGAVPRPGGLAGQRGHQGVRRHDQHQRLLPVPLAADAVPVRRRRRTGRLALRPVHPGLHQRLGGPDRGRTVLPGALARGPADRGPAGRRAPGHRCRSRCPTPRCPRTSPPRWAAWPAASPPTGTSKFEKAVALQQWFRVDGGFRYSLRQSPGNGTDDLVGFLSTGPDGRVGYCEQFAAAMAVMGRTLGIPSRVAVGFLRPELEGDDYVYSSHDLHAWPEMYFEGVGWVRFEPTPQGRTGSVPAYTTQQVPQAAPSASASASASTAPPTDAANRPLDRQNAADAAAGSSSTGTRLALVALVAALAVALLLAPALLRRVVRRRRLTPAGDPRSWAEAGWRELRATARDLGVPWDDHVSLRTTAHGLTEAFGDPDDPDREASRPRHGRGVAPEAEASLARLVGLLERARYARTLPADATTHGAVLDDVDRCTRALYAGAGRRRAVRARWWPQSLVTSQDQVRRGGTRRGRRLGLGGAGVDRAV